MASKCTWSILEEVGRCSGKGRWIWCLSTETETENTYKRWETCTDSRCIPHRTHNIGLCTYRSLHAVPDPLNIILVWIWERDYRTIIINSPTVSIWPRSQASTPSFCHFSYSKWQKLGVEAWEWGYCPSTSASTSWKWCTCECTATNVIYSCFSRLGYITKLCVLCLISTPQPMGSGGYYYPAHMRSKG